MRRIEEVIQIEAGEKIFPVYVRELGFSDGTSYLLCKNFCKSRREPVKHDDSESISNSNLEEKGTSAKEGGRCLSGTEGEVLESMYVEKDDYFLEIELPRTLYNEKELTGGVPNGDLVIKVKEATALKEKEICQTENVEGVGRIDNKSGGNFGMGLGEGLLEKAGSEVNKMEVRFVGQAQENGSQTDLIIKEGMKPNNMQTIDRMVTCFTELVDGSIEKLVEPKRSWAKVVEDNVNSSRIESLKHEEINSSDTYIGTEPFDVPEVRKGKRIKRKSKKFGSLLEIQNSKILESERRKKDHALKRMNWSKLHLEESELSGKTLSDSDISNKV
ncbi:hypothetical protein V6N13_073854 [Hibiscus sabdariffa]